MVTGFPTEQEEFWSGQFGNDYIDRNSSKQIVACNLSLFAEALRGIGDVNSILEFGANIGLNLQALHDLFPQAALRGIEINSRAAKILADFIGRENVIEDSFLSDVEIGKSDLVFSKGVLIHVNPQRLLDVYQKIFDSSNRYIFICEYFSANPETLEYRGHQEKLFKRDFAGELLDIYGSLRLRNYGFRYRRDATFPLDNLNWFLLEKLPE